MASVTKISLDHTKDVGVFNQGPAESAARVASKLLQEDLDTHHIFFNDAGFHDHIVHHILTVYALGASAEEIQAAYDANKTYQLPVKPTDPSLVQGMHDINVFKKHMGIKNQYPSYLAFFQKEIEAKGVEYVIKEYIFAGTEFTDNMFSRLFGGLLHPLIHLGFGLEFNQPAIIAQALAETAVHEDKLGRDFYFPAEQKARQNGNLDPKSLAQILNEIRADEVMQSAVKMSDPNKMNAMLDRVPGRLFDLVGQYVVPEDRLEESLADMINTVSYFTAAAQRPNKAIRMDFFLLHTVTCSMFFSTLFNLPWLDQRSKARMLEWKGRIDLLIYSSRGNPNLLSNEISEYPVTSDWKEVFARSCTHPTDDGHLAKLVRAFAHGERVCRPFENKKPLMPISGEMWLQAGNMAVDSSAKWIFETGFEEPWRAVPARVRL